MVAVAVWGRLARSGILTTHPPTHPFTNPPQSCWLSNGELAPVFVDRSYAGDRRVAAGYFQVGAFICIYLYLF